MNHQVELLEAHGALRDLEEQALADLELELGALTSERSEISAEITPSIYATFGELLRRLPR